MDVGKLIEGSGGKCDDRIGVFDVMAGLVLVVADGAGGMGGSAEAAEMAVQIAREGAPTLPAMDACCKLLYQIDAKLSRLSTGGQTTCVVAVVSPPEIYGASVGDSAAWVISEDGIANLTEHQMRKPLIGSGAAHPTPFKLARKKARLLLASDGLVKYASAERIKECVMRTDVHSGARDLVELVRYPSGKLPDDAAIILAELER